MRRTLSLREWLGKADVLQESQEQEEQQQEEGEEEEEEEEDSQSSAEFAATGSAGSASSASPCSPCAFSSPTTVQPSPASLCNIVEMDELEEEEGEEREAGEEEEKAQMRRHHRVPDLCRLLRDRETGGGDGRCRGRGKLGRGVRARERDRQSLAREITASRMIECLQSREGRDVYRAGFARQLWGGWHTAAAVEPTGPPALPLCLAFQEQEGQFGSGGGRLLCVGDEFGEVTFFDTSVPLARHFRQAHQHHPQQPGQPARAASAQPFLSAHGPDTGDRPIRSPVYGRADGLDDEMERATVLRAHSNAIFTVRWCAGDTRLVTCSGDQTCRVWDVECQTHLMTLRGHSGSVKAVDVHPETPHILVTGARDGHFAMWDTRTSAPPSSSLSSSSSSASPSSRRIEQFAGSSALAFASPTLLAQNAHAVLREHGGSGAKPKRRRMAGMGSNMQYSVTCVRIQRGGQQLFTGGVDGCVKLWDMRALPSAARSNPAAAASSRQLARGRGVSSICLRPDGTKLYACMTNADIHCLDASNPALPTVSTYNAPGTLRAAASYYVRAALSPCGDFLACGNSDGCISLWREDRCDGPIHRLEGHELEVSDLSWSNASAPMLASCADDYTARVWVPPHRHSTLHNGLDDPDDEIDDSGEP